MDKETGWRERFQYWLDNLFSKGVWAMIAWLGILSLVLITVAAGVVAVAQVTPGDEGPLDFSEAAWRSLMRTLDAGTMGGDTGWGFRLVMFFVTLGGVFTVSTLIGVLSSGIEGKLEELSKGRSRVMESGHIVILGWAEQIFTVISELVAANANQPRCCIVILGRHDKVEMEREIREKIGSTGRTRIVCRNGDPIDLADLAIANPGTARAIVVLSPQSEDPDSEVIKTVLAITSHFPRRHQQPYHIVAELLDPKNVEVARLVGKDAVEWVLVGDIVARIIAQTCRQSGLSVVYTELLDFGGDEIYFHSAPALVGKTFGEVLSWGEKNAILGICPAGGAPRLNPPMDTILRVGDQLILLAEDDDKIQLDPGRRAHIQESALATDGASAPTSERTLILGWNQRGAAVINELDAYVAPGSKVMIVADIEGVEQDLARRCPNPKHQTISFQRGDTTDRRTLDGLALDRFNHIVLLCYADTLSAQQADARTLITLLHLRDIAERQGSKFSVVSEMLDIRNRNLADVTRADDFIVSDKLISLMLAQVAENKRLNAVFADLFDPEGSEIYLKPANEYVRLGVPVSFDTLVESARRRNEVAIGYRLRAQSQDPQHMYGVAVNPAKSDQATFSEADRVIVLSES